jgi:hypothetical protein
VVVACQADDVMLLPQLVCKGFYIRVPCDCILANKLFQRPLELHVFSSYSTGDSPRFLLVLLSSQKDIRKLFLQRIKKM